MSNLSSRVVRFARRLFIGLVLPLACILGGLLLKNPSVAASAPTSFAAATNFAVGSVPESVAVGDFNLDGKPDMVTANGASNNVSVLLGNGSGGFGAATNFSVGTAPSSVAIGDFNRDGKPDLAVTNQADGTMSI